MDPKNEIIEDLRWKVDYLKTLNGNLREENTKLREDLQRLEEERFKINDIANRALIKCIELEKERDDLTQQRNQATQARDAIQAQFMDLKNTLLGQHGEISRSRQDLDEARAERDGALRKCDGALRNRDVAFDELKGMRTRLQKALEQRDALSEKSNHFETCLQKANEELARVRRCLDNRAIDHEKRLLSERDEARNERDNLKDACTSLISQRDQARKELAQAKADFQGMVEARNEAYTDLHRTRAERDEARKMTLSVDLASPLEELARARKDLLEAQKKCSARHDERNHWRTLAAKLALRLTYPSGAWFSVDMLNHYNFTPDEIEKAIRRLEEK